MSAVNALDRLQVLARCRPTLELERHAGALRAGPVTASGFDYDQAIAILRHCPAVAAINDGPRIARLRAILHALVLQVEPNWKWLLPLGRSYLAHHLSPEAKQVFDAADLYTTSNDHGVRDWWDAMALTIRGQSADGRVQQGRRGERLTLAYERALLDTAGRRDLELVWVGFEDNSLGYDVRSYSLSTAATRPKYIEVKSCESDLRFYLTRNEWRAAERFGEDYFVHLWHLPTATLTEISSSKISAHVPLDRGSGTWETSVILWK